MENKQQSLRPYSPIKPLCEHLESNRSYQGVPAIGLTHGGRLFTTWFTGGIDEGPDNYVVLYQSDTNGTSWRGPVWVADPQTPGTRAFDPQLWTDPAGRLWWFWHQDYCPDYATVNRDLKRSCWGVCCETPDDDELVWSEPKFICYGTISKPIVLSDGSFGFVAYQSRASFGQQYDELFDSRTGINFYRADNDFKNVRHISTVCPKVRTYADECDIVETEPGKFWIFYRSDFGIGECFSDDNGEHWSEPVPVALRGADSRVTLTRLPNGDIMTFFNALPPVGKFGEGAPRKNLTVAFTKDTGRSWYKKICVDERLTTSYPNVALGNNGEFWVVYDCARYVGGEIWVARFKDEELLEKHLVSKTAPVYSPTTRKDHAIVISSARNQAVDYPFVLPNGMISAARTSARTWHDQENLYIEFICQEPDISHLTLNDEVWQSDCLDVYLAPDPDYPRRFFQLLCDFKGRTQESIVFSDMIFTPIPVLFNAQVTPTSFGWETFLQIPWKSIFCNGPHKLCGNIFRRRYSKQLYDNESFQCLSKCSSSYQLDSFVDWNIY